MTFRAEARQILVHVNAHEDLQLVKSGYQKEECRGVGILEDCLLLFYIHLYFWKTLHKKYLGVTYIN